jgi:hypothetical protein
MYIKSIQKVGIYGVTMFIMSGHPDREASYWFGAGALPVSARRGPWRHPAPPRDAEQTPSPFAPAHAEPIAREKAAAS